MQLGYTQFNKEVLSNPYLLASASAHITSLLSFLGCVRELGGSHAVSKDSRGNTPTSRAIITILVHPRE
jgi:hypothetical protein